ncbi:MAG: glycosyltransferase [Methylibium sp.]|nr:glycosyltransferase [Methylibium sp.]
MGDGDGDCDAGGAVVAHRAGEPAGDAGIGSAMADAGGNAVPGSAIGGNAGSAERAAAVAAPVMLYVGRLAAEKNVSLALRAFEAARARVPATRMVVVGDGPLRRRLEAEFPAARFVGMQRGEALAAHYASADVFLFPSLSETFGNVTLEALASGLAVLAFDAAAAAEHIRHGSNGLLAAPGDEADFIDQACRLAASPADYPELLPALRAHARETALAVGWDAVLRRFESRLLHFAARNAGTAVQHAVLA